MVSSFDVADYFITRAEESGQQVSNLKLQKLVYYAQAFSLALKGKPLFDDDVEAWGHGPVVSALYHNYKRYGGGGIPCDRKVLDEDFESDDREILRFVFETQGHKGAWELRQQTHKEDTWLAHSIDDNNAAGIITHDEMIKYFSRFSLDDAFVDEYMTQVSHALSNEFVEVPDEINSADEFVAWVRRRGN